MNSLATHLSALLLRLNGSASDNLARAIAALCEAMESGHVCLPASAWKGDVARLRDSAVVGASGDFAPLILDESGNLYLHRYWQYEDRLARAILTRARAKAPQFSEPLLSASVKKYAASADATQLAAAENVVRRRLSVITGGPGTGKTRTATLALILLAEQFAASGEPAHFALAAPTGKAAARLYQSLDATLAPLELPPDVRALLPTGASTLHRLLGALPGATEFRHSAANPLPARVVVVDEASMVDLPLMAKLFDAIHPEARVILLGDKNQLASVESGHMLGDICAGLSGTTGAPLRASLTELTTNHRFAADSGIHRLSRLVNAADFPSAAELLRSPNCNDLRAPALPSPRDLAAMLCANALTFLRTYRAAETPAEALARFGEFRILCALREGPYGVTNLNVLAERCLADAGLLAPEHAFYAGRPVLIRRNDYQLQLFNGDIGITLPDADADGELRVFFHDDTRGLRRFPPARLPEHETAFAMTVHKAQGSEFRHVLLVMPGADCPVLSRELLYTAITRASTSLEVWWSEPALQAALDRTITRWSGLRARLWGEEH